MLYAAQFAIATYVIMYMLPHKAFTITFRLFTYIACMLICSFSDARLVIMVPRELVRMETQLAASTAAGPSALPSSKQLGRDSQMYWIRNPRPSHGEIIDWVQGVSIPVHRIILTRECSYFEKVLEASLAENSLSRLETVIPEHAASQHEVHAILAALECVYTSKMTLLPIEEAEWLLEGGHPASSARLPLLVSTLKV